MGDTPRRTAPMTTQTKLRSASLHHCSCLMSACKVLQQRECAAVIGVHAQRLHQQHKCTRGGCDIISSVVLQHGSTQAATSCSQLHRTHRACAAGWDQQGCLSQHRPQLLLLTLLLLLLLTLLLRFRQLLLLPLSSLTLWCLSPHSTAAQHTHSRQCCTGTRTPCH
jgi:hypothetical protein